MKKILYSIATLICVSLPCVSLAKTTVFNDGRLHRFSHEDKPVIWGKERNSTPPIIQEIAQNTGSYSVRVIERDYEAYNPLPVTGQTTIVSLIDRVNSSQRFAPCPENSQLIEFAESSNFLVQICLQETANDSTVFWMGYAKDGRGSLTVKIDENFEFWNFDTYYAIERRPLGENSYLLIGWPNGTLDAEALLYYYHPCFGDDC